jgi:DNA-binding transcriptional regulator PaaX
MWYIPRKGIGNKVDVLTLGDLKFLKELKAAGDLGRSVRELNIRAILDRLVKAGYLVGRPTDRYSVQYRITQRGRDY